jgi:hypothetical protein
VEKSPLIEEVFCEADLPYGHWNIPKLPLSVWGVLFRLAWFCGYSSNVESLLRAEARALCAAKRLLALARKNGSVFLVGHGIMNMLIAKQLLAMGWSGPKRPVNKYWQFSVYHAPAYRDREAPHSAPLPDHAAYGSVLRGSADQAGSSPGDQKTK